MRCISEFYVINPVADGLLFEYFCYFNQSSFAINNYCLLNNFHVSGCPKLDTVENLLH